MTINELFAKHGLAEDVIQAIMDDMKANSIFTTSMENMDIRHGKLKEDHDARGKQLDEANALIEKLQKDNKNNEGLQKSVADYQAQLAAAKAQAARDRLEYQLKLEFMSEGAEDLEYVIYKVLADHPDWKDNPETAFDESGKLKSRDDIVSGTKTKLPSMFKAGGGKKYEERKLPTGDDGREPEPQSLEDALRMTYENKKT